MDETTRKVFRDNVQMSEVMGHHIERKDELEKKNAKLTELYKRTKQECEINEITGKVQGSILRNYNFFFSSSKSSRV